MIRVFPLEWWIVIGIVMPVTLAWLGIMYYVGTKTNKRKKQ